MIDGPVLVTGATGNIGRAVVGALQKAGLGIRAADLSTEAIHDALGDVEAVRLDFLDPTTFGPALAGAGALFLLRPPAIAKVGPTLNALIDVAADLRIGHVVFSSVSGADRNRIVPHHRVERHLQASPLDWTILRPGFFAQNLGDAYRADIVEDDRIYLPAGDAGVAFIDVRDIGDVAAEVLLDPTAHRGRGYTLTGPCGVTFHQVAALLTRELGRPIRYEPATALGYVRHLRARRLPLTKLAIQVILHLRLRDGHTATVDPTLERLIGHPGRSLETYIADHRHLWLRDGDRA